MLYVLVVHTSKYIVPYTRSPPSLIFSVLSGASRHFSKSASRVKKFRARDSKDMELTAIGYRLSAIGHFLVG